MGGQGEIFQRVHVLIDECEELVESGRAQMERAREIVARSRRQAQVAAEGRAEAQSAPSLENEHAISTRRA